ncbi:3' terminal RNA ribose 2'-O-methyltransferase Hen1 [Nostocaceae cyanobacterium CENA369]|uniref:Small RNA 2'-O-methyltransferase n=1 Tax=Dendronalium phyllosphericum CENA369 TaxID=1725256 RepID=A0A8J7I875_9NOST|nr:3' terminal RNA ribose 2'-O-methyltransferase Hen1 [Dendronalium phyllosphericum]MBH8575723.1 3' terminal RNA ribose 2'-O-methyltransferase Hen1 [Dendronalium phyllosphericum CENA369]
MLLTITTTHSPATELGYLLHKHPDRCQSFSLSFGQAHVFYPEASIQQCTAALLLDVDPVKLVRGRSVRLEQYVNDRPYVASSFLSVAIAQVFSTALAGRCKDLPELVQTPLPLVAKLSVLPCRGGESFLRELFEPLGYSVSAQGHILDEQFPDWGQSQYFTVELQHTITLSDLLSHLYVLIPVLDDEKHYWVGDEEIEKLLRHGEGWLTSHPAREQITRRYLKRQQRLTRLALAQLAEEDNLDPDSTEESHAEEEAAVEKPISLNQQRMNAVIAALKQSNAKKVIDLGCGQGNLLKILLKDSFFEKVTGVDVSYRALEVAQERLDRLRLPRNQWERIQLIQGALTYQDKRLNGYDAATVIEVIEHLDLPRLGGFERVLFEFAQPKTVVVTTPNIEYNVKFENLPAGKLRHQDHRFEWTRQEFQIWANKVAERFGYTVQFQPVGTEDPEVGSPTQMGVFTK